MALETLTGDVYIDALNSANPVVSDDFDKGVDHLQGIKNVLKKSFPNIDGAVTATPADLNATSTLATDYAPITRARKNMMINGCFRVWQRGAVFTGIGSGTFCADRWRYIQNASAVMNISQQIITATSTLPFIYRLIASPTAADTSIGSGQYAGIEYGVEGMDCHQLRQGTAGAQTVTLSFWHSHTMTGTHSGSIRNSAVDRSYVFEYTQAVADSSEYATVTIPLDTTGTWLVDGSVGMFIHFNMAVGSTYRTTAGSWVAGNYIGSSNQVNNLSSTGNYFRLANVQLELGDTATSFEMRSQAEEEALCYRYFYKQPGGTYFAVFANGANDKCINVQHPVPMRATPTTAITYGGTTSGAATVTGSKMHTVISHTDTDGGVASIVTYTADSDYY